MATRAGSKRPFDDLPKPGRRQAANMVLALHAVGVALVRGFDGLAAPGTEFSHALMRTMNYEQYCLLSRLETFYPEFDVPPPELYAVLREAGADDEALYALLQAPTRPNA